MFIFSAACAIPAYLTGEGAEELVENLPGVGEDLISAHEDMAYTFLWMTIGVGLIALITFFSDRMQKKSASALFLITFVAALGTMVFAQRVGTSGGNIRHTEIRSDVIAPGGGERGAEKDDD
jgi:drug/metabolite transporter (DMT)-like permease